MATGPAVYYLQYSSDERAREGEFLALPAASLGIEAFNSLSALIFHTQARFGELTNTVCLLTKYVCESPCTNKFTEAPKNISVS